MLRSNVKTLRNSLLITILSLAFASGCATTGGGYRSESAPETDSAGYTQNSLQSQSLRETTEREQNVEKVFELGANAYKQGELDKAEKHFREVVRRKPRHGKATYNLSMIYLQRAYEGLKHFTRLGAPDSQVKFANRLIQRLDNLNPDG